MGEDGTVEQRVLNVLQDRGQDWVVDGGLVDGDRVVVDGLQKAAPGAKVTAEERIEEAPSDEAGAEQPAEKPAE